MKKKLQLAQIFLLFLCTTAQSQTQNALSFDATDDYVQTTYAGVTGSANRTFESWIYISPSAPSTNLTILDYGVNAAGARNTFMVNGNRGLSFFSGGTNANLSSSTGVVPVGQWTHVAFVLNNSTGFLYIDGLQVGTGNLSSVDTPTTGIDLRIGRRVPGGTNLTFAGELDEVRIWNVARTQTEISTSMSNEICQSASGIEAYYKFNQGNASASNTTITSLTDSSGLSSGTLFNFALSGTSSNWVSSAVTLTPIMDLTVTENNGVLSSQQSGAAYRWVDCANNRAITGATSSSYSPTTIGDYAVEVTINGCTQLSDCVTVSTLSMDNHDLSNLNITQNPSQYLSFNGMKLENAQISIHTLSGKELLTTTLSESQIIKPTITTGLYMVSVTQDNASKTFKWIKN
ncbi:LamG-like jellyroll fold domain-containing protein [Nonlabens sp. Asnod3-A02]|uniref:LamG-like jellyroll fold domain-containing protein n=1 Tax=Nonlabens sp. Asnod3-A02 TaxID=3160579 RepID=UPI0038632DFE